MADTLEALSSKPYVEMSLADRQALARLTPHELMVVGALALNQEPPNESIVVATSALLMHHGVAQQHAVGDSVSTVSIEQSMVRRLREERR